MTEKSKEFSSMLLNSVSTVANGDDPDINFAALAMAIIDRADEVMDCVSTSIGSTSRIELPLVAAVLRQAADALYDKLEPTEQSICNDYTEILAITAKHGKDQVV